MRILQLIDTLDAGGAERMAVNYANGLATKIVFSGIVASRKEGALVNELDPLVGYMYLNRKSVFDILALKKLRHYIIKNNISIIHAHSTSFFLAFLIKITYPKIRLIWHDHYGDSEFLDKRNSMLLKITTPFFEGVIAVNEKLKIWATQKLNCKNSIYLPNFVKEEIYQVNQTFLSGVEGKRIICLANLRPQKNHFFLIEVAKKMQLLHSDWSFHLIGKDFNDEYSTSIKDKIKQLGLENNVFLYGSKADVAHIMQQVDIAILTSQSEGLPVALLEYGWFKKPVVITAVGEIPKVVEDGYNGFLLDSFDVESFYKTVVLLIEDPLKRMQFSNALYKTIIENYSEDAILNDYLNWLQNI